MGGFDLGSAVPSLSYDFTTGPSGWDPANGPGKGVIGDPNRKAVMAFQRASGVALGLPRGASEAEVQAALAGMDDEQAEQVADALLGALADLCAGSPSYTELATLSVRGLNAFSGYMYGALSESNPT